MRDPRTRLAAAIAIATLFIVAVTGGSVAAGADPATGIAPVRSCASLTGAHLPDTVLTAAAPETSGGHTYCDIHGVIAPQTRFEIMLPTTGWHGQYLQQGCSALCGAVDMPALPLVGYECQPATDGQLALGTDDGGHTATDNTDGQWAQNDPELRVVFGITSEHSLRQVAGAVIARYYGRPPAYTYFDGCSTGGRQALTLAQRYPTDFNGIIAGSPAANVAPLGGLLDPWLVEHNTDSHGHQVLTSEKLPALHAAVIRRCGDADGIVPDPRQCAFQPSTIRCPAGTDTDTCLTPAQVAAVVAVYRGPTDPAGRSLYNGGEPYGSELGWAGAFVEPAADTGAPADTFDARIALNYLKYLAYPADPPAGFTLADVRFTDATFDRLNVEGNAIYDTENPDLTAFRDHGGRLIVYHGWADPIIPPFSTIDYYAAMERTMGGFTESQSFSRLYLIPGAYHCLFGPDITAPTEIAAPELLTPLIDWVQRGTAPAAIGAPILSLTDGSLLVDQTVAPYDALAPVATAPGSLNGGYHYIGG